MKYQIFLAYVAVIMLTHQLCVSRLMINYYDKALEKEVWKGNSYSTAKCRLWYHRLCCFIFSLTAFTKIYHVHSSDIQYTQSNFGIYPYGHSIIAPLVLPYVYDAR